MKALILHDIRSAENVGSLFRTADAAGIDRIYLTGITPSPIDRFNRPFQKIAKAALGAEKTIAWEKIQDIDRLIADLKEKEFQIIAIEQSENAVDYKTVSVRLPVAFMLGNEVDGIPEHLLNQASIIAEIPMSGTKESLNVSVAGGIALFRILNL